MTSFPSLILALRREVSGHVDYFAGTKMKYADPKGQLVVGYVVG